MTKDQIAQAIRTHAEAEYNGGRYTVQECVLHVDKFHKELMYSAILLDRNGRTEVRAPIDMIDLIERETK